MKRVLCAALASLMVAYSVLSPAAMAANGSKKITCIVPAFASNFEKEHKVELEKIIAGIFRMNLTKAGPAYEVEYRDYYDGKTPGPDASKLAVARYLIMGSVQLFGPTTLMISARVVQCSDSQIVGIASTSAQIAHSAAEVDNSAIKLPPGVVADSSVETADMPKVVWPETAEGFADPLFKKSMLGRGFDQAMRTIISQLCNRAAQIQSGK